MTTIIYDDKSVYRGDVIDGKRHGKGVLTSLNGVYEGEWKNDKKDGRGKETDEDGGVYEGEWKEDKRAGFGTIKYSDGECYEGEWRGGEMNGIGKFITSKGVCYEGEMKNGIMEGKGKITYPGGNFEGGEWINGHLVKSNKITIKIVGAFNLLDSDFSYPIDFHVLLFDSVLDIKERIKKLFNYRYHNLTLYWRGTKLRSESILSNLGIKDDDIVFVTIFPFPDEVVKRLEGYLYHDDENVVTKEQFLTLPPKEVHSWMSDNIHAYSEKSIPTIQQAWKIMEKQRLYCAKRELPRFWIDIFCDIVLNTGFKFISLTTLSVILDELLSYHGYWKARLQNTKDCILRVMKNYESKQFHKGNPFLVSSENVVVTIEEGPSPKFTNGKEIYDASSILRPIKMRRAEVLRIASLCNKSTAAKIVKYVGDKYRPQPMIFCHSGNHEWFESTDSTNPQLVVGFIPRHKITNYLDPYQEKPILPNDQFWPNLHPGSPYDIAFIQGQIYANKSEGRVTLYYKNYTISGLAYNGILNRVEKVFITQERMEGPLRNKLWDGLISMHHCPDNFQDYSIKPTQTIMLYKEGTPLIHDRVTIIYENGDREEGIFSSKLSSSVPFRRFLIEGVRENQNLICKGKFRTGALYEGEARYKPGKISIHTEEESPLISLKNISRGIYPHDDLYQGQWNLKNGILVKGIITHGDGTISTVDKGKIVVDTPPLRPKTIVTRPYFKEALLRSQKRRKALQQFNKKRRSVLHLGQSKASYKSSLFAKYTSDELKTYAPIPLHDPLENLFRIQTKPLRMQFIRRLFQDEASQKQLLEILFRVLKIYKQNRKTIVMQIRDSLRDLDIKTLRRNGNVMPTVRKALFDFLLTFPIFKEINDIYVPYQENETLEELIYAMAPKELKLEDVIVSEIRGTGIYQLSLLIDSLISTIAGNIAGHLPMKVLQGGQPAPVVEEEEEDGAAIYLPQEQQQAQQPKPPATQVEVQICSWNISWLDVHLHEQRLIKSIELLEYLNINSDFILLQETPFDPIEFQAFNARLEGAPHGILRKDLFHRAVVQPFLQVDGMKDQLHGMMILANRSYWNIVQRKKPQTYTLLPLVSQEDQAPAEGGGIISSVPKSFLHSETEIMAEQDLNRQAVWYSADGMKDKNHEPHLFTKLSTLSGLFQSKIYPSFFMIVMNIHVRKRGYDARYRARLLKGINDQIRLYIGYMERIPGSSLGIVIGGDFNRADQYIITDILSGITELQSGQVIMNPIPIKQPSIDAFLIPADATATPEDIQQIWQQRQSQLGESLFPEGGHTPFKIILTFPLK